MLNSRTTAIDRVVEENKQYCSKTVIHSVLLLLVIHDGIYIHIKYTSFLSISVSFERKLLADERCHELKY